MVGEHAQGLIRDLVAVAVRTVQHGCAPARGEAWNIGQPVAQAGRQHEAPRLDDVAVVEDDAERAERTGHRVDGAASERRAGIARELGAALGQQLRGRLAVVAEHVVGGGRCAVARLSAVDDQHPAARPAQ